MEIRYSVCRRYAHTSEVQTDSSTASTASATCRCTFRIATRRRCSTGSRHFHYGCPCLGSDDRDRQPGSQDRRIADISKTQPSSHEARSHCQGALLSLYSALDSSPIVRRWSRLMNYAVITVSSHAIFPNSQSDSRLHHKIARRRRLHNYCLLNGQLSLESNR